MSEHASLAVCLAITIGAFQISIAISIAANGIVRALKERNERREAGATPREEEGDERCVKT